MSTQRIRRIVTTAILLGATVVVAYAADIFSSMTVRSMGDEIVVQWTTGEELGIGGFIIERSDQESPTYKRMGYVQARGAGNRYTYVDNTAFSKQAEQKQYTYRIKGVNGIQVVAYSRPVSTFHDVSSVAGKSWGVIKDLFR